MLNKELVGTIIWYNHKLSTGKKQKMFQTITHMHTVW